MTEKEDYVRAMAIINTVVEEPEIVAALSCPIVLPQDRVKDLKDEMGRCRKAWVDMKKALHKDWLKTKSRFRRILWKSLPEKEEQA